MNRVRSLGILISASLLAGCTVGPNYTPPKVDVPDKYGMSTTTPSEDAVARWWTNFKDPTLESLIQRATQSNLDLRAAESRIIQARAQRGVDVAGYFPVVDANGNYTHTRRSLNGSGGFANTTTGGTGGTGGSGSNGGGVATGGGRESDLYQVGFDASWEIDVFGGTRRAVEAADAGIQAGIEDRRDVLVTLLGDVARNYIELRGRQRQLAITRDNLKSQQETLDLTRARFNAGLVGELDVARAQALVQTTASNIPTFESQIRQSIHRLGVLLGQAPSSLASELGAEGPIPSGMGVVPVGLPSDLLRRRADIRRAERQLAAQTARIGVATADYFPKFTLNGGTGLQSANFGSLFESDSFFYNVGPGISWTIFDAGRIRANVAVQNALQQQALITYQRTVLTSLEDVENSLVNYDREQMRRVALSSAVDSNRRAMDLANQLYSRGLTDFLTVQEAQRSLLQAQDQLAQSDTQVSSNLVALYKALGGGWESMEGKEN